MVTGIEEIHREAPTGIDDGFVGDFEQDAHLRIHEVCLKQRDIKSSLYLLANLFGRDAEELSIEFLEILELAMPFWKIVQTCNGKFT